jgi:hypothetical protein
MKNSSFFCQKYALLLFGISDVVAWKLQGASLKDKYCNKIIVKNTAQINPPGPAPDDRNNVFSPRFYGLERPDQALPSIAWFE